MTRLDEVFAATAHSGELALVTYLTAGYPDLAETSALVMAAVESGADVIELGVPFSDPMGDGPVIQASSHAALAAGTSTARVIDLVAQLRSAGVTVPIALMGYCNPFLRYRLPRLIKDAAAAGVDALVVPDLPAQEAEEWVALSAAYDLDLVFFASLRTEPDRLAYTASRSSGFLYCLAAEGVTGERATLDPRLSGYLTRLRAVTTLPLAVGFGLSRPEHVRALQGRADAAIVGSALVARIAAASGPRQRRAAVSSLVRDLKGACR